MTTMIRKNKEKKLSPYGSADMEVIEQLTSNTPYEVKITKIRDPYHHNRFMAMLRAVMINMPENLEHLFPTIESLITELKYQTGHYKEHRTLGGKVTYETKSISFAEMDEIEFSEFHKKCEAVILKYFLAGVKEKELRHFIQEYM